MNPKPDLVGDQEDKEEYQVDGLEQAGVSREEHQEEGPRHHQHPVGAEQPLERGVDLAAGQLRLGDLVAVCLLGICGRSHSGI